MEERGSPLFAQPLAIWERDGLRAALLKAGLPVDDVGQTDRLFWRFERDDVPVGFGGLEVRGEYAVLRSLVTLPPVRLRGIGRAMVARLETEARAHGARSVYLLATTAEVVAFFAELDYSECERETIPSAVAATAQFARQGSPSAIAMVKPL